MIKYTSMSNYDNNEVSSIMQSYSKAPAIMHSLLSKPFKRVKIWMISQDKHKPGERRFRSERWVGKYTEQAGSPFTAQRQTMSTRANANPKPQENYIIDGTHTEKIISYNEYTFVHTETFKEDFLEQGSEGYLNPEKLRMKVEAMIKQNDWLVLTELRVLTQEMLDKNYSIDIYNTTSGTFESKTETELDNIDAATSDNYKFSSEGLFSYISNQYNTETEKEILSLDKLNIGASYLTDPSKLQVAESNYQAIAGKGQSIETTLDAVISEGAVDRIAHFERDLAGAEERLNAILTNDFINVKQKVKRWRRGFIPKRRFEAEQIDVKDMAATEVATYLNEYTSDFSEENWMVPDTDSPGQVPIIVAGIDTYNHIVNDASFFTVTLTDNTSPSAEFNRVVNVSPSLAKYFVFYGIPLLFLNFSLSPFLSDYRYGVNSNMSKQNVEWQAVWVLRPGAAVRVTPLYNGLNVDSSEGTAIEQRVDTPLGKASADMLSSSLTTPTISEAKWIGGIRDGYAIAQEAEVTIFYDYSQPREYNSGLYVEKYQNPSVTVHQRFGYDIFGETSDLFNVLAYVKPTSLF